MFFTSNIQTSKIETNVMFNFQFNGIKVAYNDNAGSGNPLVLLHSGGSSSKQWERLTKRLCVHRHILAPDFYGHGSTEEWTHCETLNHDDQADLVAATLEFANLKNVPIDVVGHSYGRAGAVRMAIRNLACVRSLILIEPMLTVLLRETGDHDLYAEYEFLANGFLERVKEGNINSAWQFFLDYRNGNGSWTGYSTKARERFFRQTDATFKAFLSNLSNPTTLADIEVIQIPVTVICGENTTAPDRRVTEILRDTLPNARYKLIKEAEHMSPLTHPAEVANLIERHLSELGRS